MRLVNQIVTLLSEDNDQLQKFISQARSLDDNAATLTTQQTGVVQLAASEADTAFAFGEVVVAKYVIVLARQAVDIKINGTGNDEFRLAPLPAVVSNALSSFQKTAQSGHLFLGPTNITSLHFSNPSISDVAEAYVAIIGEG